MIKEVGAAFDDHYASLTLIRIDCEESLSLPRRPCERAEIGVSGSQQVRSTTEHKNMASDWGQNFFCSLGHKIETRERNSDFSQPTLSSVAHGFLSE